MAPTSPFPGTESAGPTHSLIARPMGRLPRPSSMFSLKATLCLLCRRPLIPGRSPRCLRRRRLSSTSIRRTALSAVLPAASIFRPASSIACLKPIDNLALHLNRLSTPPPWNTATLFRLSFWTRPLSLARQSSRRFGDLLITAAVFTGQPGFARRWCAP